MGTLVTLWLRCPSSGGCLVTRPPAGHCGGPIARHEFDEGTWIGLLSNFSPKSAGSSPLNASLVASWAHPAPHTTRLRGNRRWQSRAGTRGCCFLIRVPVSRPPHSNRFKLHVCARLTAGYCRTYPAAGYRPALTVQKKKCIGSS
ncbi:hypothetical protein DL93DRAFT_1317435 [Clavulina sp. PMI_390]|nr:hypothetical protein DL93DRAFT_1317435 [Clavulina sp. PMI_390]